MRDIGGAGDEMGMKVLMFGRVEQVRAMITLALLCSCVWAVGVFFPWGGCRDTGTFVGDSMDRQVKGSLGTGVGAAWARGFCYCPVQAVQRYFDLVPLWARGR
jgi:hypothetical protein